MVAAFTRDFSRLQSQGGMAIRIAAIALAAIGRSATAILSAFKRALPTAAERGEIGGGNQIRSELHRKMRQRENEECDCSRKGKRRRELRIRRVHPRSRKRES